MPLIQTSAVVRSSDSGTTPQEFIFPSPLTAGSSVLLLVVNYTATALGTAIISDGSQALNLDGVYPSLNNRAYVYSLKNITSTGAANPKVTLTPGGSTDNYITGVAIEISEKITWDDVTNVVDGTGNRTITNVPVSSNNFVVSVLAVNDDTSNADMSVNSGCTQIFVNQTTVNESGAIGVYSYNPSSATVTHVINVPTVRTQGLMSMYSIDSTGPTDFVITPSGGVVFSGAPALVKERVQVASGGVVFSGAVTVTLSKQFTISPSGGVVFAGAPAVIRERSLIPSGGIVFSGAPVFSKERILTPAGGVVFGGTGDITFTPGSSSELVITPSGGITFSGISNVLRERSIAPNGGVTFGGAVSLQRENIIVPSGGILFDGNTSFARDRILTPAGGINFGGNGGAFFLPAGGVIGNGLWDAMKLNVKVSKSIGL